jgi:hypothetical protein
MNFAQFFKAITIYGLERIGLFYGTYEGEVVEVDAQHRARIKCHALWPDNVDAPANIWAWPAVGPVHPGGGMWWPPAEGDPVWIKCRMGRPQNPVYGPGWWGDEDLPDDAADNLRFLRTPEGWTIAFRDTKDAIPGRMILYSPDQTGRIIMEADGRIDLFAGGSNSWFTLLASGSLQHVTAGSPNNRFRVNADGTIFLGHESEDDELIRVLVELVTALTVMTTPTAAGPQPPVNLQDFIDTLAKLIPYVAPMP